MRVKPRLIYAIILLLFFVLMFYYQTAFKPTTEEMLNAPIYYAGNTIHLMGPYGGSLANGFRLIYNHKPIAILYQNKYNPPRYGEVLIEGILLEDGQVYALHVHNYDYNYFIYALSFLAGVAVLICFFCEWRITRRGFEDA